MQLRVIKASNEAGTSVSEIYIAKLYLYNSSQEVEVGCGYAVGREAVDYVGV